MKRYPSASYISIIRTAALALLPLVAFSCREDDPDIITDVNAAGEAMFIIDEFVPEGETKTACSPGDECTIIWSEGDIVGVFPREGYQEPFTLPANLAGLPSATFDCSGWMVKKGLDYCAYYPFDIANFESAGCKTSLDAEDDVATVSFGSMWHIPTIEEMDELRTKCTWKWSALNGVDGYEVTGPSGKSIFLPAAGFYDYNGFHDGGSIGQYWSRSLDVDNNNQAHVLRFSGTACDCIPFDRFCGLSVRPVCQ